MKRIYLILLALALATTGTMADHLTSNLFMSAKLSGAEQVPAVTTDAMGLASFVFNEDRTRLTVRAHMVGLSGAITGIHLHAAARGSNGPVVFDLMPGLTGMVLNHTIRGITKEQLSLFMREGYYLNVHTAANPNGEVRGQVMPERDWSFVSELSGANENPAVTTAARGLAIFNLSLDKTSVEFFGVTSGLKMTGVHLHRNVAGANGPVVLDLVPFKVGDTYVSGRAPMTPALVRQMMSDSLYMNVHTVANPGGEIRGQLMHKPGHIYFDSRLNSAQSVPTNSSRAVGLGIFILTPTMDSLWVKAELGDSLTSAINSTHIHNGAAGVNGTVQVDLDPYRSGARHNGVVTGATLTNAVINTLMAGNNYMNVHTTNNITGEIRGQIYKTAREGFTFFLDGSQQVPPVTSPGAGFAVLSYDRDMSSLHYMVNWTGLSGPVTGAHFHVGGPTQTGPVIFDIMSTVTGSTSAGYWNLASATPFSPVWARRLRRDSMYVNVHTSQNPGGEVRGQVLRATPTGLAQKIPRNTNFVLSPNPVENIINVLGIEDEATVTLHTASGIQVSEARIRPGQRFEGRALPPGLYFYRIKTRNAQNTGKLVKL